MAYRIPHHPLVRLAALLALLTAPLAARAAEPVFPANASVGLVPPPGMTPAKTFAGFEHWSGASIVIAEMPPEAYPQLVERFTPETLRATGFEAQGAGEPLAVAGGEGRILRGSQAANGLTYTKWVAIVRGAPGTGLVTVQVPQTADAQVPGPAVEAALRTIGFRAPASLSDQIAALPYTVGDLGGLRPVRVFMGSGLLLTDGPKDVDPEGTQALAIVTPSMGQVAVPAGGEGALARKAFLGGLPQITDVAVTGEDRSVRAGATVVRLQGTAKDARSGRSLRVTQTMLFARSGYLRLLGVAGPDQTRALDGIERVAASLALR
ncbi:hypothetical protein ABIE45_003712 [Methylobacterium sp. OAE515]|uniref:hypothetical protein n=1 Tax=Methylobacterium sp. OAE515 TaxID=2817895 RepID=UPI001A047B82